MGTRTLLDDVMSEEDAFSEAGRRYIKEWYPRFTDKIMPNGSIVIINTRYHEDDICVWLLSNQGMMNTIIKLGSYMILKHG